MEQQVTLSGIDKKISTAADNIALLSPLDADSITFGAKCVVTACLPYNKPKPAALVNGCWLRTNGEYSLWIQGGPKGIPYGTYPRLFAIWLTSEAIRKGDKRIYAGGSIRAFLAKVGVDSSRGKRGAGKMLIDQTSKFLEARAAFRRDTTNSTTQVSGIKGRAMQFVDEYEMLWDPRQPDQEPLFDSYFTLSEAFFDEITTYSIPLDMRAVAAIKSSPMALDIYQWLAYRLHYIKPGKPSMPKWSDLQMQFGAEYSRPDHFKLQFIKKLKQAMLVYPDAKVTLNENGNGLILKNSSPPVPKKLKLVTSR